MSEISHLFQLDISAATIRSYMYMHCIIPQEGFGEINVCTHNSTCMRDDLYHAHTFEVSAPITPHWKELQS